MGSEGSRYCPVAQRGSSARVYKWVKIRSTCFSYSDALELKCDLPKGKRSDCPISLRIASKIHPYSTT